ncbi:unnamed protein product [Heligmosomoides polygyrus]|uniref:Reverse transcriptase domain-containing protein n=1 Tax=Heligmosomoides polygyrus TaxID=6339 RepID=A0A183FPB8_HELPZ|nr:unnamed protein product [Heligmosomoides polygyrus]
MLQLPRDQTDLTHDEDLRTPGRPEADGDGTHLLGAVRLHVREVNHRRHLHRSLGDGEVAFLDLKKAYDRLSRAVLWKVLRGRGVPERLITDVKDMYEGSKAAIRSPHWVTRKMDITMGAHQGSAPSPFLVLLTLDSICITFRRALALQK